MIPAAFDYVRPADLDETLRILTEREGEAKLLAGGYSLIPLLKLRLAQPGLLVDLRDVAGLDGILWSDDSLRIGGRVTHRKIRDDEGIAARHPLLHDAAGVIGDPQIRNRGTIGGSCAHADPSSDWPAVLCASRATVLCRSAAGTREIAARDFFLSTFVTAIEPTEVLVEIVFPIPGARSGGAYRKLERRAGDFATVGIAAQLRLGDDGRIAEAGIGLTAVAEAPFAATDAEGILVGAEPGEEAFRAAGEAAAAQSDPADDSHGPADYKRAMVAEMTIRALRAAAARATTGQGGQQ
jgi:carbon-monoxide dehydrogenase medium subunit